jgi:ankyrin repeat protein
LGSFMKLPPLNTLSTLAFTRPAIAEPNSDHSNTTGKTRAAGWHRRDRQGQQNHDLRRALAKEAPDAQHIAELLAAGADPGAASLKRGDTAAHALARSSGVPADQAAALLARLTDHGRTDVRASNAQGDTPLHLALDSQSEVATALLAQEGYSSKRNLQGHSVHDVAQAKLADSRTTALFSYKAAQLKELNPTQPVLQAYQLAKRLNEAVEKAGINESKRPRVRFVDPLSLSATARVAELERQLAQAQRRIEMQNEKIAQLQPDAPGPSR